MKHGDIRHSETAQRLSACRAGPARPRDCCQRTVPKTKRHPRFQRRGMCRDRRCAPALSAGWKFRDERVSGAAVRNQEAPVVKDRKYFALCLSVVFILAGAYALQESLRNSGKYAEEGILAGGLLSALALVAMSWSIKLHL